MAGNCRKQPFHVRTVSRRGPPPVLTRLRSARILSLILLLALLLLSTISMGIYTTICGIVPIMLGLFYLWYKRSFRNLCRSDLITVISVVPVIIIGMMIYHSLMDTPSRNWMSPATADGWETNILQALKGVFQIFGSLPGENVAAASLDGAFYLIRGMYVIVILFFFLRQMFRQSLFSRQKNHADLSVCLFAILFLYNLVLMMVLDTRYPGNNEIEYRYMLIGIVPLIIHGFLCAGKWIETHEKLQEGFLRIILIIGVIGLMIAGNSTVMKNLGFSQYEKDIVDQISRMPVDSVLFIDSEEAGIVCRSMDLAHHYGTYSTESNSLILSHSSDNASATPEYFTGTTAVVIPSGIALPEQFSSYTWQAKVSYFDIYTGTGGL